MKQAIWAIEKVAEASFGDSSTPVRKKYICMTILHKDQWKGEK